MYAYVCVCRLGFCTLVWAARPHSPVNVNNYRLLAVDANGWLFPCGDLVTRSHDLQHMQYTSVVDGDRVCPAGVDQKAARTAATKRKRLQ